MTFCNFEMTRIGSFEREKERVRARVCMCPYLTKTNTNLVKDDVSTQKILNYEAIIHTKEKKISQIRETFKFLDSREISTKRITREYRTRPKPNRKFQIQKFVLLIPT